MSKNNYRILGQYQITYESNGFVQDKILVSIDNWDNIFKPLKKAITIIEDDNKGNPNKQSKLIKDALNTIFYDYTICIKEGSPMHESIKTGIIALPETQGGNHKVRWKKIS